MVQLHSYNGYVVVIVTKWLCFYVCKTDRGGQKESIMDEYLREPAKEREMVLFHFWLQVRLLE